MAQEPSKPPTPTLREAESEFERAMHNFEGAVRVHQSAPQDSCIVEDCKLLEASRTTLVVAAQKWVAAARASALEEAAKVTEPWPHELPLLVHTLTKRAAAIRALKEPR